MKLFPFIIFVIVTLFLGAQIRVFQNRGIGERNLAQGEVRATRSQERHLASERAAQVRSVIKSTFDKGGEEEWLRWLALLEQSSPEELPSFVAGVGNHSVALGLIAERWVALDPERGFRYLQGLTEAKEFRDQESVGRILSREFFARWSEKDLSAALAPLNRDERLPMFHDLQAEMVKHLCKVDVEQALLYKNLWGVELSSEEGLQNLSQWIESNPQRATALILERTDSELLDFLAKSRSENRPQEAIRSALQKGEQGSRFARLVFEEWIEKDFTSAWDWFFEEERRGGSGGGLGSRSEEREKFS